MFAFCVHPVGSRAAPGGPGRAGPTRPVRAAPAGPGRTDRAGQGKAGPSRARRTRLLDIDPTRVPHASRLAPGGQRRSQRVVPPRNHLVNSQIDVALRLVLERGVANGLVEVACLRVQGAEANVHRRGLVVTEFLIIHVIHVCIYIYLCCFALCLCVYIYIYIYIYICVCCFVLHMCIHIYCFCFVHAYIYIYIHMCACMQPCITVLPQMYVCAYIDTLLVLLCSLFVL